MVDTFTQTTGGNAAVLIEDALDLKVQYYLMQMPQFRQHMDFRPVQPAHDGPTVTVTVHGELAPATTPIDETVDVDARDIPATRQVSVTMDEYGATNLHTLKVATFDWSGELASTIAFQLADNMRTSLDLLTRAVFDGASNEWFVDSTPALTDTDPAAALGEMNADAISSAVAALRARRSIPRDGSNYVSIMHPHVCHDVRREAGPNTWASPHEYVSNGPIFAGETGTYAGARIIEHNRAQVRSDQGTGTDTYYTSYFLGREAAMEAAAIEPHAVIGPVVDKLKRFYPVGWHGLLGWSLYRQNSLQLIQSGSSLGTLIDLSTYDPKA